MKQETLDYLAGLTQETRDQILAFIKQMPLSKEDLELIRFETFSTTISADATAYDLNNSSAGYTTNQRNNKIIGFALSLSDATQIPAATLEMYVDGKEVFQAGTPAVYAYAATNVNTDSRFFNLIRRDIKQSRLTGKYTANMGAGFAAHTAVITLMVLAEKPY